MNDDLLCKIADFGLSRELVENESSRAEYSTKVRNFYSIAYMYRSPAESCALWMIRIIKPKENSRIHEFEFVSVSSYCLYKGNKLGFMRT